MHSTYCAVRSMMCTFDLDMLLPALQEYPDGTNIYVFISQYLAVFAPLHDLIVRDAD